MLFNFTVKKLCIREAFKGSFQYTMMDMKDHKTLEKLFSLRRQRMEFDGKIRPGEGQLKGW